MVKGETYRLYELGLPTVVLEFASKGLQNSPHGRAGVESTLKSYEEQLQALKKRGARLKPIPRDFHQRREVRRDIEGLGRKIAACEGLLSSLHEIPYEVMGEIFSLVLEDNPRTIESICLTCKLWNAIAVSTPSLWSKIVIDPSAPVDASALRAQLQNAQTHPSTLTLAPTKPAKSTGKLTVAPAQSLNAPPSTLTLPHTTSLAVHDTWTVSPSPLLSTLPALPNLTHAVLSTAFPSTLPKNIPWSRLTHLCLTGNVPLPQWCAIMRCCLSLRRGVFALVVHPSRSKADAIGAFYESYPTLQPVEGSVGSVSVDGQEPVVVLPDLTDLTFLKASPFESAENVHGLSFPALSKLRLLTGWREPHLHLPPRSVLLPNSAASLRHLVLLQDCFVTAEQLVSATACAPGLEALFVRVTSGVGRWLKYLTYGHDGKFNMRNLRVLGMYLLVRPARWGSGLTPGSSAGAVEAGEDSDPFKWEEVGALVKSRTKGAVGVEDLARLERFVLGLNTLGVNPKDGSEDMRWIKEVPERSKELLRPLELEYGVQVSTWVDYDVKARRRKPCSFDPKIPEGKHWGDVVNAIDREPAFDLYSQMKS